MNELDNELLKRILNGYHSFLASLDYKAWQDREAWSDPIGEDLEAEPEEEEASEDCVSGPECTPVPDADAADEQTESASRENVRAVDQLMALTGLDNIKAEVLRQLSFRKIMRLRELDGKRVPGRLLHILLTGRPGTGKTTVARLIAKIFHEEGLLGSDSFRETNRAELVGQWIGETEARTSEIIESARGGVLFIDEIYSLATRGRDDRDFGRHVVDTLMPLLSDDKSDIMVIGAGYPDEMKEFLRSNPGLASRFPLVLEFEDFTEEQLVEIAAKRLAEFDFTLDPAAEVALRRLVSDMARIPDAANARVVITTVENHIIPNFSERVSDAGDTEAMVAGIITADDIPSLRELSVMKLGANGSDSRAVGFRTR